MSAKNIGTLTIDLVARIGGFEAGLDKAGRDAEKFSARQKKAAKESAEAWASVGKAIGAGLAVGVTALGAMVVSAINTADSLNDLSASTGVAVEDLAGLSYAAKLSGTDLEGVAYSVNKLSMNIGKDSEKFKALGITAKDPIDAFKQLADVFVSIEDPQTRAALGAATLGKSWASAAPLLAEGGKGIGDLISKGKELTGITKETAEEAAKFNDQLDILKVRAGGAATAIAGPLITSINDLMSSYSAARNAGRGFWESLSLGATGSDELEKTVESNRKSLEKNAEKYGKDSEQYMDALHNLQVNMQRQSDAMVRAPFVMPSLPSESPTTTEAQVKKLLDTPTTSKTSKTGVIGDYQKFIESLQKEIVKVGDLTRVEEVLAEIQSGRLGKVTAAQSQYLVGLAAQVESIKESEEAWSYVLPSMEKAAETSQQLLLENQALAKSYLDIIDPARELKREIQKIKDLEAGNLLSPDESVKAIERITEAWKKNHDEMDIFTRRAAENIQDSIGEGLVDIMDGNFKDIGSSFAKMLQKMTADALAANLARSLFGSSVSGGSGDGLLGGLLPMLGGLLGLGGGASAGATSLSAGMGAGASLTGVASSGIGFRPLASKGYDIPAGVNPLTQLHEKEMVLPREHADVIRRMAGSGSSGTSIGGGGINYSPVISMHFESDTDMAKNQQMMQRAVRQANAELIDKLSRAGRL